MQESIKQRGGDRRDVTLTTQTLDLYAAKHCLTVGV